MAAFNYSTPVPFGTTPAFGVMSAFRHLFSGVSNWIEIRNARISLNSLSSHQLNDIGIEPGQIEGLAHGVLRR